MLIESAPIFIPSKASFMNPSIPILAVLLSATPLLAAEAKSAKAELAANTVILNETAVKNLRLQTLEADEQEFEETVFALGRIEVIPERRAAVSSRVSGRVVALEAVLGEAVKEGAIVAKLESRQPGDPPPVILLKAPMSGLVTETDVRLGDPVGPDKALLEITDLTEVFAVAHVPEHLAGAMKPGTVAHIRITALPGEQFEGVLLRFGTVADRASGTVDAIFKLPNPNLTIRPGMRAEFSVVLGKRDNVLAVPRQALQGEASNRFLYVANLDLPFAYVKVPVITGAMNDRFVEIKQGLLPGDKVVTEGAYSLAYAGKGNVSLKEALDAAHGHEHAADGGELPKGGAANAPAGGDGHDHGSAPSRLSGLTLVSLIANGVLLVLLAVAAFRRPKSEDASVITQPKPEGSGHA